MNKIKKIKLILIGTTIFSFLNIGISSFAMEEKVEFTNIKEKDIRTDTIENYENYHKKALAILEKELENPESEDSDKFYEELLDFCGTTKDVEKYNEKLVKNPKNVFTVNFFQEMKSNYKFIERFTAMYDIAIYLCKEILNFADETINLNKDEIEKLDCFKRKKIIETEIKKTMEEKKISNKEKCYVEENITKKLDSLNKELKTIEEKTKITDIWEKKKLYDYIDNKNVILKKIENVENFYKKFEDPFCPSIKIYNLMEKLKKFLNGIYYKEDRKELKQKKEILEKLKNDYIKERYKIIIREMPKLKMYILNLLLKNYKYSIKQLTNYSVCAIYNEYLNKPLYNFHWEEDNDVAKDAKKLYEKGLIKSEAFKNLTKTGLIKSKKEYEKYFEEYITEEYIEEQKAYPNRKVKLNLYKDCKKEISKFIECLTNLINDKKYDKIIINIFNEMLRRIKLVQSIIERCLYLANSLQIESDGYASEKLSTDYQFNKLIKIYKENYEIYEKNKKKEIPFEKIIMNTMNIMLNKNNIHNINNNSKIGILNEKEYEEI